MSEEIETTESIRDGYAFNRYNMKTAHVEFDLWYAEEIRKAKEEAWDSGFGAARTAVVYTKRPKKNPYRKEQND